MWNYLHEKKEPSRLSRWWQLKYFSCSPLFGEMIQFDEHIFQMGWFNHHLVMKGFCYFRICFNSPWIYRSTASWKGCNHEPVMHLLQKTFPPRGLPRRSDVSHFVRSVTGDNSTPSRVEILGRRTAGVTVIGRLKMLKILGCPRKLGSMVRINGLVVTPIYPTYK